MTVTELWPEWQGAVINGVYPLQRILHGSDHSAVFLTEYKAAGAGAAAIKIVPAERVTLAQLAHWKTAAALSHPHLIRLLDAGLYQPGGRQFLFVVMEYADQTLAQVLPGRALTADEVREMLRPTLDALAYLHGQNLVQGQLKPANFLVVDDRLKLASDTVRPAGEPRASLATPSLYDPPEAKNGALSPAGDIWGLGITMVEALTQCLPWPDEHAGTTALPATLPPAYTDTIQRCLSRDPARRPTAGELQAEFSRAPQASGVPVAAPVVREAAPALREPQPPARAAAPPPAPPRAPAPRHSRVAAILASACLVLLAALWGGRHLFHGRADAAPPTADAGPSPAQPAAGAPQNPDSLPAPPPPPPAPVSAKARGLRPARHTASAQGPATSAGDASASILHEEMPVVAHSALRTIHGHVKVTVRVRVDGSGNVTEARLENAGPSSYFARAAKEAAGKWKFAAADGQDAREWLVRFEFSGSGATGHATAR